MRLLLLFSAILCFSGAALGQAPVTPAPAPAKTVDPPAPEGFTKYYFVMLTKGAKRDQDRATVVRLTESHLDYMEKLTTENKCLLDGTFMDDGAWRGFLLIKAASIEEARQLTDADPAVVAGRVAYEVHPWMTESEVFRKAGGGPAK